MKMLRKIIADKSQEISQEKFYDEVSFSKVTNLKCSDCNFATEITHHWYFWNMYLKLDVLKKQNFEEKVYGGRASNKIATLQYTALDFIIKTELKKWWKF